jgi:hypothetical protein
MGSTLPDDPFDLLTETLEVECMVCGRKIHVSPIIPTIESLTGSNGYHFHEAFLLVLADEQGKVTENCPVLTVCCQGGASSDGPCVDTALQSRDGHQIRPEFMSKLVPLHSLGVKVVIYNDPT